MFVLIQCGSCARAYLTLIRLTEHVLLLEGFGDFAQRVDTTGPILPPTLIKFSTTMGFKGSNLPF